MKLAVISDLHGNYYALAKVLAFLRSQEIDGIRRAFSATDDESASRNAGGVSLLSGAGKQGRISAGKSPASAELEGRFLDKRTFGLYVSESYRTGSGIFRTAADRRSSDRKNA